MLALSVLAVALTAATSTMAHPMARSSTNPACAGFGPGATDTLLGFSIGAINTTLPNANLTGAPIVVNSAGAFSDITVWRLGTWAQYSYPLEYTDKFSLENGTLILTGNDGAKPARATTVDPGNSLDFSSLDDGSTDPKEGAQIYCVVPSSTERALIAVNGDTDSFALCQSSFENVVFYKPAPDRGYDINTCYPVKLQVVFY
ncbi:hypothetical protein FKP32DRAFT_1192565 [Trametes sanguinea]|nr:hypothetical protein FKP32DRAFT_1192565 [Trametes sanguinea]